MHQALLELDARPRRGSARDRFQDYDRRHPEVWELFVEFSREARRAGLSRYSARAIVHRIRWECSIHRQQADAFRINDHYAGHYARKLIASDPARWSGFFELREMHEESRA